LLANGQPKNEQGCSFLGEDVRGSKQKRVCVANSSLSSVQGGSLLNSDRDVGGSHQ